MERERLVFTQYSQSYLNDFYEKITHLINSNVVTLNNQNTLKINEDFLNNLSNFFFYTIESNSNLINQSFKENQNYDLNPHALYYGSDWIYSYVEPLLMFDFKLIYIGLSFSFLDDFFNYFYKVYTLNLAELTTSQLINSILMDYYTFFSLFNLPLFNSWYNNLIVNNQNTFILLDHPEFLFISKYIVINYVNSYISEYYYSLYNLLTIEAVESTTLIGLQLLLVLFIFFSGIVLYFSFFSSPVKEENLIDQDYMLLNITIEAEEEIASMDDILMLLTVLFSIFGWFFLANFWYIFMTNLDFSLLSFFFPILFIVILFIPTLLLYSFGIHFVTYLRGVASVPVFILEQIFDYVAIKAFYIRILVQGVRLLLMTFVFVSLHDLILFIYLDQRTVSGNESIFDDLHNVWVSKGTTSYYFFWNILGTLFYWIYELIHTLFVLTAQFTAFFAMVFWLFFFLYTSFVLEKQEAYLQEKREHYNQFIKKTNPLNV